MLQTLLHTVNKSPFNHQALKHCLDRLQENHALILLEDGVYGALATQPLAEPLKRIKQCYAIKRDIEARGLNPEQLLPSITLIDYEQFVRLSTEHSLIQSWY